MTAYVKPCLNSEYVKLQCGLILKKEQNKQPAYKIRIYNGTNDI